MLEDGAFLRRLPRALDQAQRLRLEALVFAHDSLHVSLSEFLSTALAWNDREAVPRAVRVRLFNLAWRMVDDLHVCRQVLKSLPTDDNKTAEFFSLSEPATLLRNKMDHLNQNVENLAKVEGRRPPIFGSISYFVADFENGIAIGGSIVTMMAGSISHPATGTLVNPAGRRLSIPVGGVQLHAFDQLIEFQPAIERLDTILADSNRVVEQDLTEVATELAEAHGVSLEDAMSNYPEGLVFTLKVKFPRPEETRTTDVPAA